MELKSPTTATTMSDETSHTETTPLTRTYNRYNSLYGLRQSLVSTTDSSAAEEKRSIKQLGEIWVMCEGHRQMHRLAHLYYVYRHIRYNLIPVTALTMASGIIAFLASSDVVPQADKQYLSLSVGILAIISTAIQTFNQESKYDSKAEMHKNAALGLKKITDNIDFILVSPSMKKHISTENVQVTPQQSQFGQENNTDSPIPQTLESNEIDNTCTTIIQVYTQVLESCQSQIPLKISQTFHMAKSRLEMTLTKQDKAAILKEYGHFGKQTIHRCLYNEVFCGITNYPGFPFICPQPDKIVKVSMKEVEKCFQRRQVKFFRMDEEVLETNV